MAHWYLAKTNLLANTHVIIADTVAVVSSMRELAFVSVNPETNQNTKLDQFPSCSRKPAEISIKDTIQPMIKKPTIIPVTPKLI